jgi:signal transduction histidine kinase
VSELESFASDKQVNVYNEVKGSFTLLANTQELHILLMNIVKNAIKYNKK